MIRGDKMKTSNHLNTKSKSTKVEQVKNNPNTVNMFSNLNGIPENYIDDNIMYSKKSKYKAIFLCCLGFIGIAGLHKFYTGKKLAGFIYLITVGCLLVGTVMDLMSLVLGDFRDSNGLYLRE
ncbi:MAG: TM2 domain-containing protein [Oscillospiraceae bacterium]|nr:TM2 domain-containing protein [Oscillospiraceae bacterium]